MTKQKHQVLLRGNGWRMRRDDGAYGYRLEGDLATDGCDTFEGSLPLEQADVARLFADAGIQWRWE